MTIPGRKCRFSSEWDFFTIVLGQISRENSPSCNQHKRSQWRFQKSSLGSKPKDNMNVCSPTIRCAPNIFRHHSSVVSFRHLTASLSACRSSRIPQIQPKGSCRTQYLGQDRNVNTPNFLWHLRSLRIIANVLECVL